MISIYGCPSKYVDAILWACKELQIYDVDLIYEFDVYGDNHGEIVDYSYVDKEYNICIEETLNDEDIHIAIFHELVHVKQILDDRLDFECGPIFWMGEKYEVGGKIYGDLPWEKEAFHLEKILLNKYVQLNSNVVY